MKIIYFWLTCSNMLTPNHSILEHNLFELFHDMGYPDVWCEGVNVLLPLVNKEDN